MESVAVVGVEVSVGLTEVPLDVAAPVLPSAAIGIATPALPSGTIGFPAPTLSSALARNKYHVLNALDGEDLADVTFPSAVFGAPGTANPGRPTRFLPAARSKWTDVAGLDFDEPTDPALLLAPQAKDGWSNVSSRKFGMPRGALPDQDILAPEVDADEEFSWGHVLGGKIPDMKKWAQETKSGGIGTREGPARITHGSYGPEGHEK